MMYGVVVVGGMTCSHTQYIRAGLYQYTYFVHCDIHKCAGYPITLTKNERVIQYIREHTTELVKWAHKFVFIIVQQSHCRYGVPRHPSKQNDLYTHISIVNNIALYMQCFEHNGFFLELFLHSCTYVTDLLWPSTCQPKREEIKN